jgi:enoyl-CoA hydratase/carnithine racemase
MYSAEEAFEMGLVDQVTTEDKSVEAATKLARELAQKDASAFRSIKTLLRKPVVEEMLKRDKDSLFEMADIWYSETTRDKLREIKIY